MRPLYQKVNFGVSASRPVSLVHMVRLERSQFVMVINAFYLI